MDLCLPQRWLLHPQALQRDDLGRIPPSPMRPVCGLRDWRKQAPIRYATTPRKRPPQGTGTSPDKPCSPPGHHLARLHRTS